MNVDRRALQASVALATPAVVANAALSALVRFDGYDLIASLDGPVQTAVVYGPLVAILAALVVAPPAAFAVTFPEDRDADATAAGFAVGAVVLGFGVVGSWWAGGIDPPWGPHLRLAVWLALLYGGTASLGVLAADAVGPLFRAPEGEDGQHPRW
jgi:hypothetical protein